MSTNNRIRQLIKKISMNNKKRHNKISLYGKLQYIRQKNCLSLVFRFSKVNVFHITLECLISVYMLELLVVLSKFFLIDPKSISSLLMLIVFPCITMIPLSVVFGIGCALFFTHHVYFYLKSVVPSFSDNIEDSRTHYEKVVRRYRKEVIVVHLLGTILYCISVTLVPIYLVSYYPSYFAHPNTFLFYMSFIGSLFGVIWNIAGIFRNQRLLWSDLLTEFCTAEIHSIVYQRNYKLLLYNAITNILSIIFLCIISILIVLNIHPILMNEESFKSLLTEYSFFVLSFGALVAFYLKKGFSLLYSDQTTLVFPSLNTILNASDPM